MSELDREPAPFTPQTLGVSFTGATLADSFSLPPDSMGDVGPTQYVVMVNGRIRSFNKTTGVADGVLDFDDSVFFDSVRNGAGVTDPRIRYDRLTKRWFLIIINVALPNRILIAVSDAASQGIISGSTVFTFFFIPNDSPAPPNACLADYPTLGVDANALYIGTNNFCGPDLNNLDFDNTDAYVVRKSSILAAGPIVTTVFPNLATFSMFSCTGGPLTPQGVDNFDPGATEGYFIGVDICLFGLLTLRRVSNPGGTPSISGDIFITVPTTTFPEDAPHLGMVGNNRLDALDDRLYAAHFRNGRLWTAHNIEVDSAGVGSTTGNRTAVRWYELQDVASPGTPGVRQAGTIFDPEVSNPRFFWIPTVMVSGQGHAALGFSTAGTNFRADGATVGRLSGDPLGTTQAVANYTASTTAYNPQMVNPQRWGDYSYTSLDPDDDMTMWTIQEFCDSTNSWGVRVVKLMAPPPATPVSASNAVDTGQSSVNVTITGTSVSGSGFYDPGPGFDRIDAFVSGGVAVNSVTFNNPTSVTLNLNTTAASSGPKDVTIINPDGQGATGTGILQVNAGGAAVPIVSTLVPDIIPATSPQFTLTVNGTGFAANAVVRWNGADRMTSFINSTKLQAVIPASDVAVSGLATVRVFNPPPGGGLSNTATFTISLRNPLPTVTGLNPPGVLTGSGGFMLGVVGSNFVFNSVVRWNGSDRPTTFVNSGLLQAAISAGDVSAMGMANVTVFSPGPGGGTSNTKVFNIQNSSNLAPTTSSLMPAIQTAGGIRDTLNVQVMGANFVNGASVVRWNGANRLTTFVNAGRVDATIPASDLLAAGTAQVTVFTPVPGGGTSNAQTFTINNPLPVLNAISPASAPAGEPGLILTVIGSSFVPGSVVRWNGTDRTTTFIGNSQLRASIPASDLAMMGSPNVTVFTPGPGGGTSAPQMFTITP